MNQHQWYLWNYQESRADGPYAWDAVVQMARSGDLVPESHVSISGSGSWQPAGAIHGLFPQMATGGGAPHGQRVHYAGFWVRFVAVLVDGVVLGVVGSVIDYFLRATGMPFAASDPYDFESLSSWSDAEMLTGDYVSLVFGIAVGVAYFAGMQASARGATLGKRLLGLRVVNSNFQQISFGQGTGRYFGRILSGLTFAMGFLLAAFHPQKRSLHDLVANTYVIYDTRLPRNAHLG